MMPVDIQHVLLVVRSLKKIPLYHRLNFRKLVIDHQLLVNLFQPRAVNHSILRFVHEVVMEIIESPEMLHWPTPEESFRRLRRHCVFLRCT